MKLVYHYIAIFFNFQTTSNHFHLLQGENCESNSQLVLDEDDNGKVRLEKGKSLLLRMACVFKNQYLQMLDLKLNKYE